MINFSEQAYEDGYDFSSLSLPEQIATKNLYTSKDDMWKKGRMRRCAEYYLDNAYWDASAAAFFESDWCFKNSGDYHAIILGCSKSKKAGSNDYIISLLIDEHQIRYIKFTPDYDSEVTETIFRELNYNLENTPYLCKRWVNIRINNIITSNQKAFSKVESIEFIPRKTVDLYIKMFGLMSEFIR